MQLALGFVGLFFGAWVCSFTVGEGWPTVIGAWAMAFAFAYFGTKLLVIWMGRFRNSRGNNRLQF